MNQRSASDIPDSGRTHSRLRFELILASALLAVGLFLVPAAVYWVGLALLGPYGDGAGMGAFYADFFGDLASGAGRAWGLALGPVLVVSWVRLLFIRRGAEPEDDADDTPQKPPVRAKPAATASRRVEPRVSMDP
jgi:hypothetical protein